MVKKIVYYLVCCFMFSCAMNLTKNEYGMPRFSENRFSLKSNQGEENKVKNLISLDCIYRLDKVIDTQFNEKLVNFKKIYLKFYENGKVAIFTEKTIAEMNPKKADMGIYQYKNNKLYFEYFSYSPQAGYFKFVHELWVEDNQLFDKFDNTIRVFTKLNLTTDADIKPDW